jgi:hypothetical protein
MTNPTRRVLSFAAFHSPPFLPTNFRLLDYREAIYGIPQSSHLLRAIRSATRIGKLYI